MRYANYAANTLNQYTCWTVPSAVDILGSATNTATATVNDQDTYRRSDYYRKELSLDNTTAAVFQSVTNLAVLNNNTNADILTNSTGTVFLPRTPESFSYDGDGNLTNDGRWAFTWDGENRLVSMQAISTVPSGAKKKLDFKYDHQGRRIRKIVSTWDGSAYVAASTNKFLYDAWNVIAELDGTNGVKKQNRLSPKEVALLKGDPQNWNWFQGLAADFCPHFLTVTETGCC